MSTRLSKTEQLSALHAQIKACRLCAEQGFEITGPPIFSGNADAQVMLIGQAPGATEVQHHRPFNFTSGTRLFKWLAQVGWSEEEFRANAYMCAMTRCYPGKHASGRGDRVPTLPEQALCARWREAELALLDLKLIIPVGKLAISLYFDVRQPLTEIIGQVLIQDGKFIVPLPHPSGASTWYMQPANKPYLEKAIGHLRDIKEELNL